jgi:acyl carrier protein
MDELIEILSSHHADIDFTVHKTLIDDEVLDSFDIISIIASVSDRFGVIIPPEEIIPENFNSADSLHGLIQSLIDE